MSSMCNSGDLHKFAHVLNRKMNSILHSRRYPGKAEQVHSETIIKAHNMVWVIMSRLALKKVVFSLRAWQLDKMKRKGIMIPKMKNKDGDMKDVVRTIICQPRWV